MLEFLIKEVNISKSKFIAMDLLVILVDSPRIGAPISRWKGRLFVELHYRTVLHQ